jgi:hypothetical protein
VSLSSCANLISFLKGVAVRNDADGYYAARILCDILPIISRLDGLDATDASNQLREVKLQVSQKGNEGRNLYCLTDFIREFSASGDRTGICRITCRLKRAGSCAQWSGEFDQRNHRYK